MGYAPLSSLERLVLAIEKSINGRDRGQQNPAWGEDVKVMAIRSPERVHITVACAMIGRYLVQMDDLEAAAGKNPVTHVGKIYNVLARQIAEALLKEITLIAAAQCLLVSRIGTPLTEPALLHLKLKTRDGSPIDPLSSRITEIAAGYLFRVPKLINELVAGAIEVF